MDQRRLSALAVLGAFVVFGLGMLAGHATSGGRGRVEAVDGQRLARSEPARQTGSDGRGEQQRSDVGFQRDRPGAVEAAASYATQIDSPAFLDAARREQLLDEFASEGARERLSEELAHVAEVIMSRLDLSSDVLDDGGFVWWSVPAGWQILSYSPSEAVVAIWGTGVFVAEGRQLDQPGWATVEVTLRWERDTWRLVSLRNRPGPMPPLPGAPGAGSVGRQIAAFEPFAHRPIRPAGR